MNTERPDLVAISGESLSDPRSLSAFRGAKLLVGGYLGISVLTLGAIIMLRDNAALVNAAVWTRGIVVVASALLMYVCALRAARGSRPAYRRLRIVSGVMVVAIVAIITLPGTFPLWMKMEQGVCGLVLIGVALIVNGRQLRSSFSAK